MKNLILSRCAIIVCGAAIWLAGCNTGAGLAPSLVHSAQHVERARSWMAPAATANNLLYIADWPLGGVRVVTYPRAEPVGVLTGFGWPKGECVDGNGDVFIVDYVAGDIVEYAHGGTNPIETLSDAGYYPQGCSVDPTTGNLAVTNLSGANSAPGNVAIYPNAMGAPTYYTIPDFWMYGYFYCTYDSAGNLFVDGNYNNKNRLALAVLPKGSSAFSDIKVEGFSGADESVQWDGKYVAVGSFSQTGTSTIDRIKVTGLTGKIVGRTTLTGMSGFGLGQFYIDGKTVVVPDWSTKRVGYWKYPAGGLPTKTLAAHRRVAPDAVVVSPAK